jgi:PhnB protein
MTAHPTVVPRIITPDVGGVVDFMRTVFDAQGEVHGDRPAELRIGNSLILVSDGGGVRNAFAAFLYVYVDDADRVYGRAVGAGATTIEAPRDMPYGDRRATVTDRWGNMWQIATPASPP